MAWTDEQRAKAVEMYKEGNPTAENSVELVKEIAEALEQTPNGVRMLLTTAGVYIKKAATTASGSTNKTAADTTKAPRVSKESQIAELRKAIEAKGAEVDDEILSKLTGKAAAYFTKVLTSE